MYGGTIESTDRGKYVTTLLFFGRVPYNRFIKKKSKKKVNAKLSYDRCVTFSFDSTVPYNSILTIDIMIVVHPVLNSSTTVRRLNVVRLLFHKKKKKKEARPIQGNLRQCARPKKHATPLPPPSPPPRRKKPAPAKGRHSTVVAIDRLSFSKTMLTQLRHVTFQLPEDFLQQHGLLVTPVNGGECCRQRSVSASSGDCRAAQK